MINLIYNDLVDHKQVSLIFSKHFMHSNVSEMIYLCHIIYDQQNVTFSCNLHTEYMHLNYLQVIYISLGRTLYYKNMLVEKSKYGHIFIKITEGLKLNNSIFERR